MLITNKLKLLIKYIYPATQEAKAYLIYLYTVPKKLNTLNKLLSGVCKEQMLHHFAT